MYPSNTNNGMENDELNGVHAQINQKTNESVESTRRMLGLVAESQEIGTNTMVALDEQGEKLKRIEEGLDNIHAGMTEAERNLTNLQKCCGLCVLPWQRVRQTYRPHTNSSTAFSSETSSPTTAEPKLRMANDEGIPQNGYITRITNDDRETEMDDNLQLVSSYLGNLKNLALDMGETIEGQNKTITRITDKSEVGIVRVDTANKRTKDLIRRA
ncbi:unnamed protein product [Rotaria magnacalcarata]|uniref:t-SNARE coiled-coil homology domain-containing protein n=3 Tax=Rotaria magnacalcarata TaxID=392030 RepID=A0A819C2I4_9BILA|nr:unnamed protein product [Rotaria magnacalcarata]CAF1664773.1 unnamed protein product [Rotaria magnacalcarata]CAF2075787.1 unnamed protein product [Rotaria magnacalcarata]CAF2095598.1 unnamed protein product [Rotaria magnacalcarata]CAF2129497.1 unnamed protein product [Rotaria magnacalcarata]